MPINTPAAPTSIAEALEQGIAAANAGGAPPLPAADDDAAKGDDNADTSTVDTGADDAGAEDTPEGDVTGDQPSDAGDGAGKKGDGAVAGDDKTGADGTGGEDAADVDAVAAAALAAAGTKEGKQTPKPGEVGDTDPITAPIPNALKRETKERIRTLVDRTKTAETSLTTATNERDELIKAITDTGASPEQYAGVLDYLELVNSGDRTKLIAAANFMIRELSSLSRIGGFRIPGITTYSGHKDLEEAVAAGKLAPELAEEIAATRAASVHQGKVGAAQQQASEAQRRYAEADTKARSDMNALEITYRKADPLYKEKQPMIVGMLNEMIRGDRKEGIPPLHPSKWAAAYKKIYETLPKTLGGLRPTPKPGATQPGGKVPQNQPLRGQQPAGAQKQEPKSVAEALDMGIEMARGG